MMNDCVKRKLSTHEECEEERRREEQEPVEGLMVCRVGRVEYTKTIAMIRITDGAPALGGTVGVADLCSEICVITNGGVAAGPVGDGVLPRFQCATFAYCEAQATDVARQAAQKAHLLDDALSLHVVVDSAPIIAF